MKEIEYFKEGFLEFLNLIKMAKSIFTDPEFYHVAGFVFSAFLFFSVFIFLIIFTVKITNILIKNK